jgi:hypothetical protein
LAAPEFAPRIINLHRKVVEHLRREVWRTFDPIPSQGMEIGGLLLGTAARETGVIEIEDFEPLAWNGRPERFVLSESGRSGPYPGPIRVFLVTFWRDWILGSDTLLAMDRLVF